MGKNQCVQVEIWVDRWWTGKKIKEQKKMSSKTIDIVSYAIEVSVNGVTCVFVVHFRSSDTFKSLQTGLTVNIHVSTKTCVTGNYLVLHKALNERCT